MARNEFAGKLTPGKLAPAHSALKAAGYRRTGWSQGEPELHSQYTHPKTGNVISVFHQGDSSAKALLKSAHKSGQDSQLLGGSAPKGGHSGHGLSSTPTKGGSTEPTKKTPPGVGIAPGPGGEYRGSEFQSRRAAAHKISS